MSTPVRLGAFVAALAVVFAAALGLGNVVGPVGFASEPATHEGMQGDDGQPAEQDGGHADRAGAEHGAADAGSHDEADGAAHLPGGLLVSEAGYTLDLLATSTAPGAQVPLRFRVVGPDGEPVTGYQRSHEKDLHLIVVRRDLTGYQHVHPELGADGVWSVPLDLSAPGAYRVYADFVPAGREDGLVLGADLLVAGDQQPVALPAGATTAQVDGYTVTLSGHLHAGEEADLTFAVTKDGVPVPDLDPYLGAYGHLVALRAGDLAYLHVHPEGHPGDGITAAGPEVVFAATAPSPGSYRLFLDFSHGGVVRTAELTVEVAP